MAEQRYQPRTSVLRLLADTVTPVSIYLRVRDVFPGSVLLEGNDFADAASSFSYICCDPVAQLTLERQQLRLRYPDGTSSERTLAQPQQAVGELQNFIDAFVPDPSVRVPFISNGLFGYCAYDAAECFEEIHFSADAHDETDEARRIPAIQYTAFRFVIAVNHFKNELYLFEHDYGQPQQQGFDLGEFSYLINNKDFAQYRFSSSGVELSNFEDERFIEIVREGIRHVHRGDAFQLVLSRRFSTGFAGDEFNVYRALRSINPSPYLFYFDCGSFKIFGSSPESQLTIDNGRAVINPIAGTFRRSGDPTADARLAQQLENDPKENAEHVMLVDLARNDLSKHCSSVAVERYREVHYFSHVIHLVSEVGGKLLPGVRAARIAADTFPAGTLTGAPKYRAMELIDRYERGRRHYYGGAIGYIGFNGDYKHAIMIRSMLSKNNVLHYQAGAGIVADSQPEMELNEVNNKLAALRAALAHASRLGAQQ